jgi:hypothetical protein
MRMNWLNRAAFRHPTAAKPTDRPSSASLRTEMIYAD